MSLAVRLVTLKRRAEFLRIRGGARWSGAGFLLEAKPAAAAGPPRFGFTVTKKLGNAVLRNRIRRRLKEAVRLAQAANARHDFDYVVVARPAAADLAFLRLVRDVTTALTAVHRPPKAPPSGSPGGKAPS